MQRISAGDLEVAYIDAGPTGGPPVILLHGFPYDVHAFDAAVGHLVSDGRRCIVPFLRGFGPTRFRSAACFRAGQQAALGTDLLAFMDALAVPKAVLAGFDWGGRAACVVAATWPERAIGLVSCGTAYNIQDTGTASDPAAPEQERRHWYWYYLACERGRNALVRDRERFCRSLWRSFSPTWSFGDAEFAETAAAFDNPDFVDVTLHSYRHRIGSAPGDPRLDDIERHLGTRPAIRVPTVVLMGEADGVDPPASRAEVAGRFADLRGLETLPGVGHNVPQEAPADLARAVRSIGGG